MNNPNFIATAHSFEHVFLLCCCIWMGKLEVHEIPFTLATLTYGCTRNSRSQIRRYNPIWMNKFIYITLSSFSAQIIYLSRLYTVLKMDFQSNQGRVQWHFECNPDVWNNKLIWRLALACRHAKVRHQKDCRSRARIAGSTYYWRKTRFTFG